MERPHELSLSFEQQVAEPSGMQQEVTALLHANEGLAIPQVHSPLDGGPQPQPQPAPMSQPEPQTQVPLQTPPQQPQGQQRQSEAVPYERFQQTTEQLRQAQAQLNAQSAAMMELQATLARHGLVPAPQAQGQQGQPRRKAEDFYKNPQGYIEERFAEQQEFQAQQFAKMQQAAAYASDKMALRQAYGVNSPVEHAMADVIVRHGLASALPPSQAVRVAYRMVTGHEFDEALSQGVQKSRLSPPAGGSGQQSQPAATLEEFQRMSMADFAKDPQGIAARVMASVTAQPS